MAVSALLYNKSILSMYQYVSTIVEIVPICQRTFAYLLHNGSFAFLFVINKVKVLVECSPTAFPYGLVGLLPLFCHLTKHLYNNNH